MQFAAAALGSVTGGFAVPRAEFVASSTTVSWQAPRRYLEGHKQACERAASSAERETAPYYSQVQLLTHTHTHTTKHLPTYLPTATTCSEAEPLRARPLPATFSPPWLDGVRGVR